MTKRKAQWVRRAIVAVLLIALLLGCVTALNKLFRPKWTQTDWLRSYAELPKDSVDALFVGSSHSYYSVNPYTLYQESGIASYSLGTPSMRLDVAREVLREALRRQSPRIVLLEAYAFSYDTPQTPAYLHYTFDAFPFSLRKYRAVRSLTDDSQVRQELMIPFLQFHSRWKELEEKDIQALTSDLSGTDTKGHAVNYAVTSKAKLDGSAFDWNGTITQANRQALTEIAALCRENGARLVVWSAPTSDWNTALAAAVAELTAGESVEFWDLASTPEDFGIKVSRHFCDEHHLNETGSRILSTELARRLTAAGIGPTEMSDARRSEWNEFSLDYTHFCYQKYFPRQKSATTLAASLTDLEGCTILVAKGNLTNKANAKANRSLSALGLADFGKLGTDKYAAVVTAEGVRAETSPQDTTTTLTHEVDGHTFVVSSVARPGDNGYASITFDGVELVTHRRGVAIALYDERTHQLIDAFTLDIRNGANDVYRLSN